MNPSYEHKWNSDRGKALMRLQKEEKRKQKELEDKEEKEKEHKRKKAADQVKKKDKEIRDKIDREERNSKKVRELDDDRGSGSIDRDVKSRDIKLNFLDKNKSLTRDKSTSNKEKTEKEKSLPPSDPIPVIGPRLPFNDYKLIQKTTVMIPFKEIQKAYRAHLAQALQQQSSTQKPPPEDSDTINLSGYGAPIKIKKEPVDEPNETDNYAKHKDMDKFDKIISKPFKKEPVEKTVDQNSLFSSFPIFSSFTSSEIPHTNSTALFENNDNDNDVEKELENSILNVMKGFENEEELNIPFQEVPMKIIKSEPVNTDDETSQVNNLENYKSTLATCDNSTVKLSEEISEDVNDKKSPMISGGLDEEALKIAATVFNPLEEGEENTMDCNPKDEQSETREFKQVDFNDLTKSPPYSSLGFNHDD